MKKFMKICALLLVVVLAISNGISVCAAGTVFYNEDAEEIIFEPGTNESPTNLFGGFQNVMPGDVLTDQISIRHNVEKDEQVVVFLRSKGAQEGSEAFLSQLKLTVERVGRGVVFDAPADETAGLRDWVRLGTVPSGEEVTLELTLEVPITLGDEFQKAAGYIDWEFRVDVIPVEEDDIPQSPESVVPTIPPTGDSSPIGIYIGLIILCGLILIVIRKRKKQEE